MGRTGGRHARRWQTAPAPAPAPAAAAAVAAAAERRDAMLGPPPPCRRRRRQRLRLSTSRAVCLHRPPLQKWLWEAAQPAGWGSWSWGCDGSGRVAAAQIPPAPFPHGALAGCSFCWCAAIEAGRCSDCIVYLYPLQAHACICAGPPTSSHQQGAWQGARKEPASQRACAAGMLQCLERLPQGRRRRHAGCRFATFTYGKCGVERVLRARVADIYCSA